MRQYKTDVSQFDLWVVTQNCPEFAQCQHARGVGWVYPVQTTMPRKPIGRRGGNAIKRTIYIYIYVLAPPPKPMFLSAGVQLVSIFVHLTMYYKYVQIHKVM